MEERRVEKREQTMAANDNRWSDLHGDLLVEIARWVKWYEDFVSLWWGLHVMEIRCSFGEFHVQIKSSSMARVSTRTSERG